MIKRIIYISLGAVFMTLAITSCKTPSVVEKTPDTAVPEHFDSASDTANTARVKWQDFFTDPYLSALIDTALNNNQELNIILQEIAVSKNEIQAKKGEYLPSVDIRAGAGLDKVGRYTSRGASEATTDIEPGREMPEPLPDFMVGAFASWEADIWGKLHNAKRAAVAR